MNKKKILIVSRSFYPQNNPRSFRTTELAKEFSRQGHEVTVLIPDLTEETSLFAQKHGFSIKSLGRIKWKLPQFGNSKLGYFMTRAAVRFFQLAFEYPDIELMFKVNKALTKENGYDLLISVAVPYPNHWGVAMARTKKHPISKIWVADCGDPYMGDRTDSFRKWFYFKYVEKWFMRKADYASIPVESARSAYYKDFHNKIVIIPQGFKIETNNEPEPAQINNRVPVFGYAGGFIPNVRDPRPFLQFLTTVDSEFRFVIHTSNPDLIVSYKEKLGSKLQIFPYIPREELLKKFSSYDFLVNFDNNTTTAVPSKLIDYAIINRPVLNITKTINQQVVQQFLRKDYSGAMAIPPIDQFRIETVCRKFLALLPDEE